MENLEKEKSREELVAEAGKIILSNLADSGLAEKIVENSAHAPKPFLLEEYTKIEFGREVGTGNFKDGIWVVPRLFAKSELEAVTLKLYRLRNEEGREIGEEERSRRAARIWDNVGELQKKALAETALEYLISKYESILSSEEKTRGAGVDKKSLKFTMDDAREELIALKNLQKALSEGTFSEKIENNCASLGIKPADIVV